MKMISRLCGTHQRQIGRHPIAHPRKRVLVLQTFRAKDKAVSNSCQLPGKGRHSRNCTYPRNGLKINVYPNNDAQIDGT